MDDEMPLKTGRFAETRGGKGGETGCGGDGTAPVTVSGRTLAKRFWGKEWMKSLSACEVYGMRLAPGRTYLRYGCVLDLKTVPGRIDALVMGEHLYEVCIQASPPDEEVLARLRALCAGQIGSWIDLLKGTFVSPSCWKSCALRKAACFPRRGRVAFFLFLSGLGGFVQACGRSPDAFGVMLDKQPELLFTLRGMDSSVLIPKAPEPVPGGEDVLDVDAGSLSDIFGISLD